MRRVVAVHPALARLRALTGRLVVNLREFGAVQAELHERRMLAEQPWREELLHWCHDGRQWRLHGDRIPVTAVRSSSRSGWCPVRHRAG